MTAASAKVKAITPINATFIDAYKTYTKKYNPLTNPLIIGFNITLDNKSGGKFSFNTLSNGLERDISLKDNLGLDASLSQLSFSNTKIKIDKNDIILPRGVGSFTITVKAALGSPYKKVLDWKVKIGNVEAVATLTTPPYYADRWWESTTPYTTIKSPLTSYKKLIPVIYKATPTIYAKKSNGLIAIKPGDIKDQTKQILSTDPIPNERFDKEIIVLGDSISDQAYWNLFGSWTRALENAISKNDPKLSKYKLWDCAVGGATTSHAKSVLMQEVLPQHRYDLNGDIVMVNIGINDLAQRSGVAINQMSATLNNLIYIIKNILDNNGKVIFISMYVPPGKLNDGSMQVFPPELKFSANKGLQGVVKKTYRPYYEIKGSELVYKDRAATYKAAYEYSIDLATEEKRIFDHYSKYKKYADKIKFVDNFWAPVDGSQDPELKLTPQTSASWQYLTKSLRPGFDYVHPKFDDKNSVGEALWANIHNATYDFF